MSAWGTAEDAIAAIERGEFVVVVDGTDDDSEGDLVMAASRVTPAAMAFLVRHCSGLASVALKGDRLDTLDIPMMVPGDESPNQYAVSVDLIAGTTTGISASDRAATVRALADPATRPSDLTRPGHVMPQRARSGGLLERCGRVEAAADLAHLAGHGPAGLLCELLGPEGSVACRADLEQFAEHFGLALVSIDELAEYRRRTEATVERFASASVETPFGTAVVSAYRDRFDDIEHVSVEYGQIDWTAPVLVRMHSECLTGDVFGSARCDCGPQLGLAQKMIAENGSGLVVYLRGHEGRGIGLGCKLQAYNLQDAGLDTVDANLALGLPADARDYAAGAAILRHLGARQVRLLTNNPAKSRALTEHGVEVVDQVPLLIEANPSNRTYLKTKQARMGHLLAI